jgi:predicted enzyme related to lactoylglutathione lyase
MPLIKGIHALYFTPKASELRTFMRDKLELPFTDTGDGWLIFDFPEGDLGCHPSTKKSYSISFYCDDIEETVAALKKRGVKFTSKMSEQTWGYLTHFKMPGDFEVELFQPKYRKKSRAGLAKKPRS